MSDIAIRVDNLSKAYRLGGTQQEYETLRDKLAGTARALANRCRNRRAPNQPHERFWALRDVSLEVKQGEVLGIVGRNGAGKSTLLKVLSRITVPTTGRVVLMGRVASLLEVGTGFHPELTGRENVYLNGAILGMTRAEMKRKFDEIVAFSEVEKFLETPVKHYSSGMYVRLAFAVAAHLDPEILLVDEVLAVGDADIPEEMSRKDGRCCPGGPNRPFRESQPTSAAVPLHRRGADRRRTNCLAPETPEAWSPTTCPARRECAAKPPGRRTRHRVTTT